MHTFTCKICRKSFAPDAKQAAFMKESQAKDMTFVCLSCPNCESSVHVDLPSSSPSGKSEVKEEQGPLYRCPCAGCTGWVCFVAGDKQTKKNKKKEPSFWGCGECGSFWLKLENLRKEIEAIVKKYPYRKKSYRKLKGEWLPADPVKETKTYDERVEREPMDKAKSFQRG